MADETGRPAQRTQPDCDPKAAPSARSAPSEQSAQPRQPEVAGHPDGGHPDGQLVVGERLARPGSATRDLLVTEFSTEYQGAPPPFGDIGPLPLPLDKIRYRHPADDELPELLPRKH